MEQEHLKKIMLTWLKLAPPPNTLAGKWSRPLLMYIISWNGKMEASGAHFNNTKNLLFSIFCSMVGSDKNKLKAVHFRFMAKQVIKIIEKLWVSQEQTLNLTFSINGKISKNVNIGKSEKLLLKYVYLKLWLIHDRIINIVGNFPFLFIFLICV